MSDQVTIILNSADDGASWNVNITNNVSNEMFHDALTSLAGALIGETEAEVKRVEYREDA